MFTNPRFRRAARMLMTAAYVAVVVVLVGVVTGEVVGYRFVAVKSGSMTPALGVGDLVISETVSPLAVHPGDVVTFRDPALDQRLVTHRVVTVERHGANVAFLTKGDANRAGERWTVPVSGRIGKAVASAPALGRVLVGATPLLAIMLILTAAVAIGALVLRRIWSDATRSGHAC